LLAKTKSACRKPKQNAKVQSSEFGVCVLVIRLALGSEQVGSIQIKTKNHKISSARPEGT